MHDVRVNQIYVAPAMAGRILRRIRILAPHPDGGYIIDVVYSITTSEPHIQRLGVLALNKAYKLERDVCTHRIAEDAYIEVGGYAPPVPNYYRCTDCGDLFPNTGDTALWFPKVLEAKVEA